MNELLPRELFKKDPSMFRMNKNGERVTDWNFCVHSQNALDVIIENAVKSAKVLKSTSGRYFYWIDDCRPMCQCPKCREFSDSEQALILENKMVKEFRKHIDSQASLAHLAYFNTMPAPKKVKPEEGIFLEFAPIRRSFESPIGQRNVLKKNISHGEILDLLDENLEVFSTETAQVLEYWLDVSLFSRKEKSASAVKLPWRNDVFLADIDTYAKRGIKHITTFAVMINQDYIDSYWDISFINEYGQDLANCSL